MQAAPERPQGKVRRLGEARFQPTLVHDKGVVPLGCHPTQPVAEAAYDVAKLLVRLRLGEGVTRLGPGRCAACAAPARSRAQLPRPHRLPLQLARQLGRPTEKLKLHRQPAAVYTSHPCWARVSPPGCSFEQACSLLAGGLAADFLLPPEAVQQAAGDSGGSRGPAQRRGRQGAGDSASSDGEGEGSEATAHKRPRLSGPHSGTDQQAASCRSAPKWQGLEPGGDGSCTVRLSEREAGWRNLSLHMPARFARALAGSSIRRDLSLSLQLTTPDGV